VASAQGGLVSRQQLLDLGLTRSLALTEVRAGRWQRVLPGIYATFTGPLPPLSRVWAAVLHAGPGAAVSGHAALWLAGLGTAPGVVSVAVPAGRKVRPQRGLTVHRMRDLARKVHPAASPPRLKVECAVLQLASLADRPGPVVDVVIRVCQRRLTTARRLGEELALWPRHRWRALLTEVLSEVRDGVQSALERRWLCQVERPHGLPAPDCNAVEEVPGGGRRYRDLRYRRWGVVIELDGREAHPDDEAHRDRARDNRAARHGDLALRYGWRETATDPCVAAGEVGAVLTARGWAGALRSCGPSCTADRGRSDAHLR
jgi:hypothetical protein